MNMANKLKYPSPPLTFLSKLPINQNYMNRARDSVFRSLQLRHNTKPLMISILHHHVLELGFRGSPYFCLSVSQKILIMVWVLTVATRGGVGRFTGSELHRPARSWRAYTAALRQRQKPTHFSKLSAEPLIIFPTFRRYP